ncbi:MAG: hypothetical protein ACT6UH_20535 [Hydrogenophaga sp.]|uniref:hypothetical protein n=1 Tax=Hydrogenophaga sp. TaxID=1904254 RepID=UPI004036AA5D
MTFCAELCIELPDNFPVAEFVAFMAEARRVLLPGGSKSEAWKEFAGASNLIAWRYRASFDAWREHRISIQAHGGGRNHEDVYQQERALFLAFAAGVSSIESAAYALAAAASHATVCGIAFTSKEQRACSPSRLLTWLSPYAKAAALVAALHALVNASEWAIWVNLRNRMTHRSNLPRRHFASVGAPAPQVNPLNYAPTSSTPEVDADLDDWDALHQWLAHQLRALLVSGTELLREP